MIAKGDRKFQKRLFGLDILYNCTIILLVHLYEETSMTGKPLSAVSPAETEILRIVWRLGSATVQDVCDALASERSATYATVQTLLRRLEKKGYLRHDVKGKAHVFCPAAKREDVIRRTVSDFVDRLFGGDPVPLMMHLADHSKLKGDDIKRLKKLIDESNR
jgi:BlaI family transcriptional regulator, penicillinase repressor